MSLIRASTTEARKAFGATVNWVTYGNRRVVLHRRGKGLAAIVRMDSPPPAPDHQGRAGGRQRHHPVGDEDRPGFRNAQNLKTAIYFHCGGLDLYPHGSR